MMNNTSKKLCYCRFCHTTYYSGYDSEYCYDCYQKYIEPVKNIIDQYRMEHPDEIVIDNKDKFKELVSNILTDGVVSLPERIDLSYGAFAKMVWESFKNHAEHVQINDDSPSKIYTSKLVRDLDEKKEEELKRIRFI